MLLSYFFIYYSSIISYLFSFNKYAGQDRVFARNSDKYSTNDGDLIAFEEDVFLVLGERISFQELYHHEYRTLLAPKVIYKSILSEKNMQLLHWMTHTRYASYKSVVKYFLDFDLEKLLQREVKIKTKKIPTTPQELYIFPDLWTLYNLVPKKSQENPENIILSSQMTEKQGKTARRKIKKNMVSKVFCTHAQIFQDRSNLTKIYLHEPHKWYYANSQEPRYKTLMVAEEIKNIWGI